VFQASYGFQVASLVDVRDCIHQVVGAVEQFGGRIAVFEGPNYGVRLDVVVARLMGWRLKKGLQTEGDWETRDRTLRCVHNCPEVWG